MRKLKFVKDGKKDLGAFSWEELLTEESKVDGMKNVRFNLSDEGLSHAIMFDYDKCDLGSEDTGLMDAAQSILGDVIIIQVATGCGYHLYIPVNQGVEKGEFDRFRDDWKAVADEIAEKAGVDAEVDKNVFRDGMYGRVPNSVNSKNGAVVRLVGSTEGDIIETLDEILRPSKKVKKVVKTFDKKHLGYYNPAEFCGFIKYCRNNNDKLPYDMWKEAMIILGHVGDRDTAMEISSGHEDFSEEEVDRWVNGKKYPSSCQKVATQFADITDGACYDCPHSGRGSCPSYVSGVLPTPSASRGFHGCTKDGDINPHYVHVDDVVNEWYNRHRGRVLFDGAYLYKYTGKCWTNLGGITSPGKNFPRELLQDLKTIPTYGVSDYKLIEGLMKTMAYSTDAEWCNPDHFNPENYLNFTNGLYNIDTDVLSPHSPKDMMLEIQSLEYDPDAECPAWEDWLYSVIDADSVKLLQTFFGLAISNVPSDEYQQFLWLEGVSGTGKSTVMKVLSELITPSRYHAMDASSVKMKEGGVTWDFRGKSALLFDDFKCIPSPSYSMQWETFVTKFTTAFEVGVRELYTKLFHTTPKCTLIFCSNDPPPITSEESGALRRMRQIMFYAKPEVAKLDFRDQFKSEMSGILNWALDGLDEYRQTREIPKGREEKLAEEEAKRGIGDLYARFVREHLEFDINSHSFITTEGLYNAFIARTGAKKEEISLKSFGRLITPRISSEFRVPLSAYKTRVDDKHGFRGMRFKKGGKR